MAEKNDIILAYTSARELVKKNQPTAARKFVSKMLKVALQLYRRDDAILTKARNEAFMEQWIAVARDLEAFGITDYVLECFGLPTHAAEELPGKATPLQHTPFHEEAKERKSDDVMAVSLDKTTTRETIETPKSQGWCADMFARNKATVVEIWASTSHSHASGTGFVISEKGYLLTNDHVVRDEKKNDYCQCIRMKPIDSEKSYPIEVLESDKKADIALCKFDPNMASGLKSVKRIVNYSELQQGADCFVIGNAFGQGLAPFTGEVRFTMDDDGNLVHTAPTNPGDSGGPVINRNGEVIGINKSRTTSVGGEKAVGVANATPMSVIDDWLMKWTEKRGIAL